MAFRADFRDNPPDDPGKAAGRQVQRDIPLYVKGIYPFARKGYTPLDKRDIPLCVKGIYPFGRVVRGSSRPFRRLFRNACGVAWISRRQPLSSSRARPIRGTPRHPGHPRHPALHAPLPPSGCPGGLGCPGGRGFGGSVPSISLGHGILSHCSKTLRDCRDAAQMLEYPKSGSPSRHVRNMR